MELIRFRARGWIGFAKDMKVEEMEIDFTGKHGLVALTGENGMGKSTLLELLSPHRGFISRKGSFNAHVQARDAFKELTVKIEGELYTFTVKVDAGSTRAEGYIHRGEDVPLVNGKLGAYDRQVEQFFGSPQLFYNSVFAAQRGGKKLNELPPGEIKALFVEFLQLHRYQAYEERAKAVRNLLADTVDELETELGVFHSEKENLMASSALKDVEAEISKTESEQTGTRGAIKAGEAKVEALAGKVSADEANRKAYGELTARRAEEEKALSAARTACAEAKGRLQEEQAELGDPACVTRELENLAGALPGMREEVLAMSGAISRQKELAEREAALLTQIAQSPLAELEATHKTRMAGIKQEQASLQNDGERLQGQADALARAISGAEEEFAGLHGRQAALDQGEARAMGALDEVKASHEELRQGHVALQKKNDALTAHRSETASLRDTFASLKAEEAEESAALFPKQGRLDELLREKEVCLAQQAGLDGIDPACTSGVCRFITDARNATRQIEEVVEKIAALQDEKAAFDADRHRKIAEIRKKRALIREEGEKRAAWEEAEGARIRRDQEALARKGEEITAKQEGAEAAVKQVREEKERLLLLKDSCQTTLNRAGELASLSARADEKTREAAARDVVMQETRDAFHRECQKAEAEVRRLEDELAQVKARRDPDIEAQCDRARGRVRDGEERLEALRGQKERLSQIAHEIGLLDGQLTKAEEERAPRIQALDQKMAALEKDFNPSLALSLSTARNSLADLRGALDGIVETLRRLAGERERAQAEVDRLADQEKKRKGVQAQLDTARRELAEWEQLRYFVSKDGLQVLEIAAASPLIEEYTNNLLEHAFGGMFAIEIVTQDPESGAEVFRIMVTRNDDGSVCDLRNLSGGQQVWVLKALRLGLSMVSREMSGKIIQTAFSDEEEAALDAKKSEAYVRLYRAFLTVGGFTSCLLVTHKETVMAMCDHRLHLQPGGPVWM